MSASSESSVACPSFTLTVTLPFAFSKTTVFVAFFSFMAIEGAASKVSVNFSKFVSLRANFIVRYFAASLPSYHFRAKSRLKDTLPLSGRVKAINVSSSESVPTEADFSAVKIREGSYVTAPALIPPSISPPPKAAVPIAPATRKVKILTLFFFFIQAVPRNFCKSIPFTILCFLYFTPKRAFCQTHFTVK